MSAAALRGKTVVFTGRLAAFTRGKACARVLARGGRVAWHVSHKTSVVVAGDEPGEKLTKARAYGIEVWSEATFLRHLQHA